MGFIQQESDTAVEIVLRIRPGRGQIGRVVRVTLGNPDGQAAGTPAPQFDSHQVMRDLVSDRTRQRALQPRVLWGAVVPSSYGLDDRQREKGVSGRRDHHPLADAPLAGRPDDQGAAPMGAAEEEPRGSSASKQLHRLHAASCVFEHPLQIGWQLRVGVDLESGDFLVVRKQGIGQEEERQVEADENEKKNRPAKQPSHRSILLLSPADRRRPTVLPDPRRLPMQPPSVGGQSSSELRSASTASRRCSSDPALPW